LHGVQKTMAAIVGDCAGTADDAGELAIDLITHLGTAAAQPQVLDVAAAAEVQALLEPIAYERLSKDALAASGLHLIWNRVVCVCVYVWVSCGRAAMGGPSAVFFSRLVCALMSAMAKLGAAWPELLPRVRLLLASRVLRQQDALPAEVIEMASTRLRLLSAPGYVCSVRCFVFC
jgi:hypothetical protein